ncbi:MAG: GNAT family N-acetyltransferase, partial [Bdellovibrionota bacterium]|nr:GNAT family N-acetyltransferase [Bdellovibrionota bacterium]
MNLNKKEEEVVIRPLEESDLKNVQLFTDRWIGQDYYSYSELYDVFKKGNQGSLNASFVALSGGDVVGIRLTYAPGTWIESSTEVFKKRLSTKEWKVPSLKMGYFKSLFIHEDFQGKGLGKVLSNKALSILKDMGAEAVLCHSWMESPENSSQRYLLKMGFQKIKEHPKFWYEIDYFCTRC